MEIAAKKHYLSKVFYQSQTRSLKKAMLAGLDLGYSDVGIMEMLDKDNMDKKPQTPLHRFTNCEKKI